MKSLGLIVVFLLTFATGGAAELQTLRLWPGLAPGDKGNIGPEKDMTKEQDNLVSGKRLIRLGNVTEPTLTVYQPPADKRTGTAVMVCPGGAYHILAMDLEGTEVCEWFNKMGVTAFLLKYRVPRREGLEKHAAALQDAQRGLSVIRAQAQDWGIDPERIGALGFSAGGHLVATLANTTERSYTPLDESDKISARPNFTALIYPAYLTVKEENDKVSPELKISTNTPPTFISITMDDPVRVENALFYTLALKNQKIPVELHAYPHGGHGYGLRPSKSLATTWPDRLKEWMAAMDLLK